MEIKMTEYPTVVDWFEVKRRALFTAGKKAKVPPTEEWKKRILEARHSPIRVLQFAFDPQSESSYLPHNIDKNCVAVHKKVNCFAKV